MDENMLGRVSKPSRYVGAEINAIRKDHASVAVKLALAFPDTYEIGMSHIGLRILYEILNRRSDTAAERVFAPWKDMEALLREQRASLCTLESNTPLRAMDIVGFTLQYEMSYTNILNMLDLSGIPLRAAERDGSHPLIIGGGPCAFNPEPLADFFDLFVIGDGEEIVGEIIDVFKESRSDGKETLLQRLERIGGVYVPTHFEVSYGPAGRVESVRRTVDGPERIRKRAVRDLDRAPYPAAPVLPYMKTVHDRIALEISRGCTRGCRFCQAGMIYRPGREREVSTLIGLLKEAIACTGHEEVSLNSLSSGDYSALPQLVESVVRFGEERNLSVSLPSLRPGTLSSDIIHEIKKTRKTGFTIAPEAGTQRLRDVINKGVTEADLIATVTRLFEAGWESLKLYFMIGLPTETEEDLEGIARLSYTALKAARAANPRLKQITVSLSPFVPKTHTPFQWCRQDRPDEIREKFNFLKKRLKNRKITVKWHDTGISMLEGVFSRGDRRLGAALLEAWRRGCRFDGWTEEFDLSAWTEAFRQTGIDPECLLYRERDLEEVLPWDIIDTGITKAFFQEEYRRSLEAATTPDCLTDACSLCGVCNEEISNVYADAPEETHPRRAAGSRQHLPVLKRFRLRYGVRGRLRFLSHLEMMGLLARALSRAGIPVAYSQGFHPHPKIAMGPARPVGVAGLNEYFDLTVAGSLFEDDLVVRLNRVLPEEIRISGVNWIPNQTAAVSSVIRFGEYRVRIPKALFREPPASLVARFLARGEIPVQRTKKGRTKTLDIRPMIREMALQSEQGDTVVLQMMVQTGDQGGVRPEEPVLALLDAGALDDHDIRMTRIGLYTDEYRSEPFEERLLAVAQPAGPGASAPGRDPEDAP